MYVLKIGSYGVEIRPEQAELPLSPCKILRSLMPKVALLQITRSRDAFPRMASHLLIGIHVIKPGSGRGKIIRRPSFHMMAPNGSHGLVGKGGKDVGNIIGSYFSGGKNLLIYRGFFSLFCRTNTMKYLFAPKLRHIDRGFLGILIVFQENGVFKTHKRTPYRSYRTSIMAPRAGRKAKWIVRNRDLTWVFIQNIPKIIRPITFEIGISRKIPMAGGSSIVWRLVLV